MWVHSSLLEIKFVALVSYNALAIKYPTQLILFIKANSCHHLGLHFLYFIISLAFLLEIIFSLPQIPKEQIYAYASVTARTNHQEEFLC